MFSKLSLLAILLCTITMVQGQSKDSSQADWRGKVRIQNAFDLNSAADEFSPTYYKGGVVFVSNQQKHGPIDSEIGARYTDFFYSSTKEGGGYEKPKPFSLALNSPFHEGGIAFTNAGDKVYFASTVMRKGKSFKKRVSMKILEGANGDLDWEKAEILPFNNENFKCFHPTLSPTGDRLYFASDMPGGMGETDLYMVERVSGGWSRPINLGPDINTAGKEAFPFIHDSGVLFFTSNGHTGLGGYDIFMVNIDGQVQDIVNLGEPFNSNKDDFSLILHKDGKTGFFASNRDGGRGKDDLYSFEALEGIKSMNETFELQSMVQIVEQDGSKPIAAAGVRVFEYFEGKIEEDVYDYTFVPSGDGSGRMLSERVLKDVDDIKKRQQLTNRHGELLVELKPERDYLFLVTKSDYTTAEYHYTTKGKIEPERITIGMDENACFNLRGKVLTKTNEAISYASVTIRNLCDGSERTINGNLRGNFIYCLEAGCEYVIWGDKQGYSRGESRVSTVKIRGNRTINATLTLEPASVNAGEPTFAGINGSTREPIREGTTIVLENIYYGFNEYSIHPGAAKELEELSAVMKRYPSMVIELISHTDARGDSGYNMELSDKRAIEAKKYLINKGIEARRVDAFGFGETQIRNHCLDGVGCEEEEHHYNRRTEVRVTQIDQERGVEFRFRGIRN